MRILSVAIGLLFLGCAHQVGPSPSPSATPQPSLGARVPLLTQQHAAPTEGPGVIVGCYTFYQDALLVVDKTYGTAMADQQAPPIEGPPQPVMWPFDYTGYRVGSQVAVVNESGTVVAVTGQRYWITMAGIDPNQPDVPDNTYAACGPPTPEALWPTPEPTESGTDIPADP
jgi:hypothetical protein